MRIHRRGTEAWRSQRGGMNGRSTVAAGFGALLLCASLAASSSAAIGPPIPGTPCGCFPSDNVWNTDISNAAVDPRSSTLIASCGLRNLHPDFGTTYNGAPNGIPYVVVRANQPSTSGAAGRMGGASTPSGDQFFRAVQQAIPPGTRSERFAGRAPWITFTLSGIPDKPIKLGVSVADPDAQRRAETAAALRAMLQGQLAGAQIDVVADPLQAALTSGTALAWREYGLTLPAHYPLRFLDDIAGSDLLEASARSSRSVGNVR